MRPVSELAKPRLDPAADAAKLPDAACPDELRDRSRRPADELGSSAIRPRAEGARVGELQEDRERLEALGQDGVGGAGRRRHLGY